MEKDVAIRKAEQLIKQKDYKQAWSLLRPFADDPVAKKFMKFIKLQIQEPTSTSKTTQSSPTTKVSLSKYLWAILATIGIVLFISIFIALQFRDKQTEIVAPLASNTVSIDEMTVAVAFQRTLPASFTPTFTPTSTPTPSPTYTATASPTSSPTPVPTSVEMSSVTDIETLIPVATIVSFEEEILMEAEYNLASPGGYTEHLITQVGLVSYNFTSDDFLPLVSLYDSDNNLLIENVLEIPAIYIEEGQNLKLRVRATNNKSYGTYRIFYNYRGLNGDDPNGMTWHMRTNYGTLLAGETAEWNFYGRSGEQIGFRFRAEYNAEIEIYDEDQDLIASFNTEGHRWQYFLTDRLHHNETNIYTLIVRGVNNSDSGFYEIDYAELTPLTLADESIPPIELNLGELNQGSMPTPAERWIFQAPEGSSVQVEFPNTRHSSDVYALDIYSIAGKPMPYSEGNNAFDLNDGDTYILIVRPNDNRENVTLNVDYSIIVNLIEREYTINLPTTEYGQQTAAGFYNTYLFDAVAGQFVTIGINNRAFSAYDGVLRLYAPDGTLIAVNNDFEGLNRRITQAELSVTGTYRVEFTGYDELTPLHYDISFAFVENPVIANSDSTSQNDLIFNELVTLTIADGTEQIFEFSAEAGEVLLLRTSRTNDFIYRLIEQDSNTAVEVILGYRDRLIYQLPTTGIYRLAISPVYISRGRTLFLYPSLEESIDLATNSVRELHIDELVSDVYIREISEYNFEASAGDLLQIEILNTNLSLDQIDIYSNDSNNSENYDNLIQEQSNRTYIFLVPTDGSFKLNLWFAFQAEADSYDIRLSLISAKEDRLQTAEDILPISDASGLIGVTGLTSYRYRGSVDELITFSLQGDMDFLYIIFNDTGIAHVGVANQAVDPFVVPSEGYYLIDIIGIPNASFNYRFATSSSNATTTEVEIVPNFYSVSTGLERTTNAVDHTALRSDGRPLIVFYQDDSLFFRNCSDIFCEFYETSALISTHSISTVRIAMRADGIPIITYIQSWGSITNIICDNPECDSWNIDEIGSTEVPNSRNINILLNSENKPFIYSITHQGVFFYQCEDINCTIVTEGFWHNPDLRVRLFRMMLTVDDRPVLYFSDFVESGRILTMPCTNTTCDDDAIVFTDIIISPYYRDMIKGLDGFPVFVSPSSLLLPNIEITVCEDAYCASSERYELSLDDSMDSTDINGIIVDFDADGHIFIAINYRSGAYDQQFDLIMCEDQQCENWNQYEIIRNAYDTFTLPQMFIDSNGNPRFLGGSIFLFCQTRTCTNVDE
ncbi:MAG: hypothetical protein Phog2KO_32580 [Phototrophicaceae bacterium]